jgi:hypothetical protein
MPRRPPNQEQFADFHFPIQGIDLSQAFDRQAKDTTPVGLNVRAYDPITARARGGQRPGLSKYNPGSLPGGGLIQDLNFVVGTGYTAPGPSSGVYMLQQSGSVSGTNPQIATFTSPVTAGSSVLVCVGSFGGFPSGVTDAAGNSYSRVQSNSLAAASSTLWLATGVIGGFTAVSVNGLNGPPVAGYSQAIELGAATVDVYAIGTSSGVGTTGFPTGFITTQNGDLAVFLICLNNSGFSVLGAGPSWAQLAQNSGVAIHTATLGAAGSYAPTYTFSVFTDWATCGVTFS